MVLLTSADGFSLEEEIVDVSTALMMQSENRPKSFYFPLSLVRFRFG